MASTPEAAYFATPADLRAWMDANHATAGELWVGYYKKGTGTPSITWPESVDEALCVGWIDGVRKRVDDERYVIRFTPRKAGSTWSAVNVARVDVLTREGRMHEAGLRAFAQRAAENTAIYAYEQGDVALSPEYEQRFRADGSAWEYFQARPAGYRKTATHWVVSAKREETRQSRLATLIDHSRDGRTLAQFTRPDRKQG